MELLQEYVILIIVAACLAVGYIIKSSLDFIPNRFIPLIMGILGVLLNVWFEGNFNFEIFLGGLASGLAATGAFELVRGVKKNDKQ